jgi:hypothetical protein
LVADVSVSTLIAVIAEYSIEVLIEAIAISAQIRGT